MGSLRDSQPHRAHRQYEAFERYIQNHEHLIGPNHVKFLRWLRDEGMSAPVLLATAIAIVEQELMTASESYVHAVLRNIIARGENDASIFSRLEYRGWQ